MIPLICNEMTGGGARGTSNNCVGEAKKQLSY